MDIPARHHTGAAVRAEGRKLLHDADAEVRWHVALAGNGDKAAVPVDSRSLHSSHRSVWAAGSNVTAAM